MYINRWICILCIRIGHYGAIQMLYYYYYYIAFKKSEAEQMA